MPSFGANSASTTYAFPTPFFIHQAILRDSIGGSHRVSSKLIKLNHSTGFVGDPSATTNFCSVDSSDFEVDDLRCENIAEKDISDEEIGADELEKRMWKDRIKLKRIKERQNIAAQ
ncbi:hypothetical protein PTKIN_Ptkin11bG0103100 [Pterospermum kingtungense]